MKASVYEKALDWLVPVLMAYALETVARIQSDVAEVSKNMAGASELSRELDRRVTDIEAFLWRK